MQACIHSNVSESLEHATEHWGGDYRPAGKCAGAQPQPQAKAPESAGDSVAGLGSPVTVDENAICARLQEEQ